MFLSKEEKMRRWEVTRGRGIRRFMVLYGALGWGLTTAIFWLLIMKITNHNFNIKINAPIALIVFPLGGLAWAWFVWRNGPMGCSYLEVV